MSVAVGMTKQGVRNLNDMGPKKKKDVVAEAVAADETVAESPAPVAPESVDATDASASA